MSTRAVAIDELLAGISLPVRVSFFEQSIGCETCAPTRQMLQQLTAGHPAITLEISNLVLDKDRAAAVGVDRVPAIALSAPGRERIRFYGAPLGYELLSLVEAIRMTASGESGLTETTRSQIAAIAEPVQLQVFFTPTCTFCPQMVNLANRLAIENPHITATAIDATEYPDLVRRYNVNGVPKTVINDTVEIVGAASESDLVTAILNSIGR